MIPDFKISREIPVILVNILKVILQLIIIALLIYSIKKKKQNLNLSMVICQLMLLRMYIPLFDVEGRRYSFGNISLTNTIMQGTYGVIFS